MNIAQRIADNVAAVRQRICDAAAKSGRSEAEVRLVAVTKYVDVATSKFLIQAGCQELGESRPQQLWEKAEELKSTDVQWHLIGHLQRNKIRRTLPIVSLIHSIDSESTLKSVDRIAQELDITSNVLLEVNVSGDESKHGLESQNVLPLLDASASLSNVRICGLMTMAAQEGGNDVARRNFFDLRELRDSLLPKLSDNVSLHELSMGMSNDFDIAIEEGATIVRIGSILFEGIDTE